LCGTPEYIAPEVLLNKGHGKGVDWWTLGILIYEMLTGEPPFVDDDPMGIYQKILGNKLSFPKGYNKGAKSLTKKFLTADLTKRYGCLRHGSLDVKKSKWFSELNWAKLQQKKLVPPIIPEVKSDDDTSNFEDYSDSETEASTPKLLGNDPFEDF
jgi:protein kinase A